MEIDRTHLEMQRIELLQHLGKWRKGKEDTTLYNIATFAVQNGARELDCQEFVKNYNKIYNIQVTPSGIYKDGDIIKNPKVLVYRIHQEFKRYKNANKIKTAIAKDEIGLEFEAILEDQWEYKRDKLRERLQHEDNPRKFKDLIKILAFALVGEVDDVEFRQVCAFVSHFVWQTMMKLHYGPKSILKGGNEAVLILVSPKQKTGKSTTVRFMTQIFDETGFLWKARFDRLDDQFSFANLAYNYVAFFDDMHTTNAVNMGKFKQIITDDEVSFRQMYTSTEMKLPKTATLIGTSNKSPRELMYDTTGLRRFHEINVRNGDVLEGNGIDLDLLSKFDWEALYRTCPLSEETPMFQYISHNELGDYEESIRPKHVVELWLDEHGYGPGGSTFLTTKELYGNMRVWATVAGYNSSYIPTMQSFSQKMVELRYRKIRQNDSRGFYV